MAENSTNARIISKELEEDPVLSGLWDLATMLECSCNEISYDISNITSLHNE